jgi:peptide chain release factor 2
LKELEEKNDWKLGQEISDLKEEIEGVASVKKEIEDIKELVKINDSDLEGEIEEKLDGIGKKIRELEFKLFLSGKYDKGNAIMEVFSGAGGVDAQDWATILLRMFQRYCEKRGFVVKIIEQSFGEAGGPEGRIGTKSATLAIKGKYAYGFLKKETGVHRLVRQSPFSAKKLRHTSFVLINVFPEIDKEDQKEIEIREDDLKIDYFRSSGPGGQNVNKRETAVRITHVPTGIVVACQSERLQGSNRDKAMKILLAKLYQLEEERKKTEMKEIKGKNISASWGNQIRSYVVHPYKMVKDLRTDVELSNVEEVLEGKLDELIEAEVKLKA